ncbi:hypothetical protein E1218_19315 [Kribbella turkmenica]|uniref:DUF6596 domain-containing protein n=1 Tax=Kribbella turkmenica TaxID=2530375 RepID=A0A4R4WXD5_9ACTN|nr:hypothetical protein E1218_19315 [Kribbella turkmenica]
MTTILYLVFNEGYTASSGDRLERVKLTEEAIRLTRMLHRLRSDDAEVTGLLALMLLTPRGARPGPSRAANSSRWTSRTESGGTAD